MVVLVLCIANSFLCLHLLGCLLFHFKILRLFRLSTQSALVPAVVQTEASLVLSGTSFTLDETGQSIRPAERLRADRQRGMAVSYGQSFSFNFPGISTDEPMLDARHFAHKDITATLDFSNPSTRAGLIGSASQGDGGFGRTVSMKQNNFARGVLDWDSPAPTSVLPDPTIVIELALNAEAPPKDKENGSYPVVELPKDQDKYSAPVSSVPDHGSTAMLLGTAILVLGIANRRFATR